MTHGEDFFKMATWRRHQKTQKEEQKISSKGM